MNICVCKSKESNKRTQKTRNSELNKKSMSVLIWTAKSKRRNKRRTTKTSWTRNRLNFGRAIPKTIVNMTNKDNRLSEILTNVTRKF